MIGEFKSSAVVNYVARAALEETHGSVAVTLEERALGAFLGFAVGDALGATVEFMTESEITATYKVHRQIIGGGWLGLKRGQVTDDTQMCLALGNAILKSGGWDLAAVAEAFGAWMRSGPVDIGHTCRRGIRRFLQDGSLTAKPAFEDGGNGAAMRNLPVILATLGDDREFERRSFEQAHITHWQSMSDTGTLLLGRMTGQLLKGGAKADCLRLAEELIEQRPEFRFDPWPKRTSGYIVDTVQTVLYGFKHSSTFEECVVSVVNRGGDADTAGAIAGQLAGALYGLRAIPTRWLKRLDPAIDQAIREQTPGLLAMSASSP